MQLLLSASSDPRLSNHLETRLLSGAIDAQSDTEPGTDSCSLVSLVSLVSFSATVTFILTNMSASVQYHL